MNGIKSNARYEKSEVKKLVRYVEEYLKIRFLPSNDTIYSHKLDADLDCHLFPIIEKMLNIGLKIKDHCHGSHLGSVSYHDLGVKPAYIDIEYIDIDLQNSLNVNSFINYAKKKNMFIEKLFYIDPLDPEKKLVNDILSMGNPVYESDIKLCLDMCPLTEKGKIALINFLNNDDCYNYRVSSFKFDFDIINADEYDNYIHEIYVKNDKFIQDLYEYFI